jgi:hypothetical protein
MPNTNIGQTSFALDYIFYRCIKVQHKPIKRSKLGFESRLEGGGVNRANLKFINLSTTTSRVSVRNIDESEREGKKQIAS